LPKRNNYSNIGIIYKISNNVNDKIYIGQTWKTIGDRFSGHKYNGKNINKKNNCVKLSNALNKHGISNFKIEMLCVTHTQECMDYWEIYFIKQYDSIKN
jgi:group I intron endonuclease